MNNQNLLVNNFFRLKIAKLSEQFSSKVRENRWGLKSRPDLGGLARVSEHVMTSQDYKKLILSRLDILV